MSSPQPVLNAIRRYVFGFVNCHDFAVCRSLMADDYLLQMGDTRLAGRDEEYIPAVARQLDQFPDMGMAVHELLTDGQYAALYFTEHGRRASGAVAAWPGVSIYRFDGTRLAQCWVEQDHHSRRRQLETEIGLPVAPVAGAPFSGHGGPIATATGEAARRWLETITRWPACGIHDNPGPHRNPVARLLDTKVTANVIVAEGSRVAFHATVLGTYDGVLSGCDKWRGQPLELHVAGIGAMEGDTFTSTHVASNRVALARRLRSLSS